MASVRVFPVPARRTQTLRDSFARRYIPGTTTKYARARSCCVKAIGYTCPGHCATDVAGRVGEKVVAVWAGVVRLRSFGAAFGKQVTVVASDGHGAFYAHLNTITVKDGQTVKAGQQIATLGFTGQTSGPHLHFEHRRVWSDWCSALPCYKELLRAQAPS